MTNIDGQTSTGYFRRNPAFAAFSVSIESQTNRPACRERDGSVKTNALIDRQVCHQGARASAKIGSWHALERPRCRLDEGQHRASGRGRSARAAASARTARTRSAHSAIHFPFGIGARRSAGMPRAAPPGGEPSRDGPRDPHPPKSSTIRVPGPEGRRRAGAGVGQTPGTQCARAGPRAGAGPPGVAPETIPPIASRRSSGAPGRKMRRFSASQRGFRRGGSCRATDPWPNGRSRLRANGAILNAWRRIAAP